MQVTCDAGSNLLSTAALTGCCTAASAPQCKGTYHSTNSEAFIAIGQPGNDYNSWVYSICRMQKLLAGRLESGLKACQRHVKCICCRLLGLYTS